MSTIPALGSSMNEPATDDTTSAPPLQTSPVQQALNKRKKKPSTLLRNPTSLAKSLQNRAIARASRARQIGDKWGA